MGIKCDTDFSKGKDIPVEEILNQIKNYSCHDITWTGGEPTDQLTEEHIRFFKKMGYYQAIETSGIRRPPVGINYIALSPKFTEEEILRRWGTEPGEYLTVDELRVVRKEGGLIPKFTLINAKHKFISPHFNGLGPDQNVIKYCVKICKDNPKWRLSVQVHKLIGIE